MSGKHVVTPAPAEENTLFFQRLKKLGVVCFLFFLIKGLLWLFIPVALYLINSQ
jgi:hypothetical protein